MKRFLCAALVVLFVASPFALAHPMGDGNHSSVASTKWVEVSGKLSTDGKVFVADDDNEWRITNAELLKGREGTSL
jgi:hypothetical protein